MIDRETYDAKGYKLDELENKFSSICRRVCKSNRLVEGAKYPNSWDSRAQKYVADQCGLTEDEVSSVIRGEKEPPMVLLEYFDWTYEYSEEIVETVVKVKRYKPRTPYSY